MPSDKPSAEIDVDADVVRGLLAAQCPQWAGAPVRFLLAGWDNAMFTVDDDKLARIPRRAAAVPLVLHEQRWLPVLAPDLPLPVPVPLHAGTPTAGYPWPWSVVPMATGRSALDVAVEQGWSAGGLAGSTSAARSLGTFVAALHRQPVPDDPPVNPYRGIPLVERRPLFEAHLAACHLDADTAARLRSTWLAALDAAPAAAATWLHGDLHPGNVIVADGEPGSIVDFGDMCTGDPAVDLLVGWQLFDPAARAVFRAATAVDDATWARGRGWALAHGLACLANSADDPAFTALGRHTIAAVVDDDLTLTPDP